MPDVVVFETLEIPEPSEIRQKYQQYWRNELDGILRDHPGLSYHVAGVRARRKAELHAVREDAANREWNEQRQTPGNWWRNA